MTAPDLTITADPGDGAGTVYYLPLAPSRAGAPAQFKLVLRLAITNNGSTDVHLGKIAFEFPGTTPADMGMQGVPLVMSYPGGTTTKDGLLPAGATTIWSNGHVNLAPENDIEGTPATEGAQWHRNEVYRDLPAPASVTVLVRTTEFEQVAQQTFDLAPFPDPTFTIPFRLEDLAAGEYVSTSARHWYNGGFEGDQIFAHDITIVRMTGDGAVTKLRDPALGQAKENHLIWDRPVVSMGPGVVTSVTTGVEDDAGGDPAGGNVVVIDHSGLTAYYCHLRKDTTLVAVGDAVSSGTPLGRIGLSGNTGGPHTHIAVTSTSTGRLRGIAFSDAHVLEHGLVKADNTGPWAPMSGAGIPSAVVAIYPAPTPPPGPPPPPAAEDKNLLEKVIDLIPTIGRQRSPGDRPLAPVGSSQPARRPRWPRRGR